MSELTPLDKAKDAFLGILATLEGDELLSFETFVGAAIEERLQMLNKEYEEQDDSEHQHHAGCSHDHNRQKEGSVARSTGSKIFKLNKIIQDLRERLPVNAESPNEQITIPRSKEFEGFTEDNVVHVDGFLYTEDDVDELCDSGKLSRNYCPKCGSKDTKPLNFISHSASVVQLQFLFQILLKDKIKNKVVLDVGSRLGAVLYAGYLFTDAKKLIGVEMNDYFCKLQTEMVHKHRLQDRIEIMHDNLLNRASLLQSADVIIMNNVFQFFCPVNVQRELWEFLYTNLRERKGTILITVPSLQDQLKDAGFALPTKKPKSKKRKVPAKPPGVVTSASNAETDNTEPSVGNWSSWLREIDVRVTGEEFVEDIMEDELEELKLVHMYEVI
ncbi:hypothetical protein BX616_010449 [Lobosporangium transversale]|uniref:Uncharacterized protein n=1 Tax=Lobosporangium transversale TaxID=64571 RepID=A0A1Y2GAY5_9FUNG|nr:hypothetical protein BCR41DRAFT_389389 [Lobosporangium transversale]KAF9918048.1 hypothetical protein BX616_010449 [Lobosporangium transversale]ORZ05883.1 hypothetical protein BCR41DRAFT_389389 [Lobosporangium transversale]|eukprot:XP_021877264.1 hypothetical protein BCR41DRAFT_389389 [Lobosporangium transversale]